ncbi:hypothetical protein C5167_025957 [Papaver somniferum]|uniref:Uncharacterized protein n=1 Tax=Papaver somniferum TaxID=3469 RepID=A0A4Y7JSX4_PAPSO|nr:hypothetical protein C5167_025957 [Papaver somniferum]
MYLNQSNSVASTNDTTITGLSSPSSSSPTTVKYLPGFPGPLPFHLETGKPEEDPLIFWFSGGPRCSSLTADILVFSLYLFLGPINIEIDGYVGGLPKLVLNRDSWTKIANIIFPDAPVYTGFSYSKYSPNLYIGDKESSKSSYEFVIKEMVRKWIRCNLDVPYKKDILCSVGYYKNISTKLGYRALIYSGDHDFMVPHVSTEAWIRSLNLSIVDDWPPWLLDDQFAGT